MSKGALVVGVAASAATVSGGVFSNTPSQHEVPSATPMVSTAPATQASSRPANSPSAVGEQKKADVPAAQLPAATTPASPSSPTAADLQHGAVPEIFKECVERYLALRELGDSAPAADRQAVGEVCKAALAQSGLSSADFWAKFGPGANKTEPKTDAPKSTADLEVLVKECVAQRLAGTADQSDACKKAIAFSGLTPAEFWTKFSSYLGKTTQPSTDVEHWIKECVTKYTRHTADATETCKKAIQLTGLTSAQFAEKYLRTVETKPTTSLPTTTPAPTVKPVTNTAELAQLVAKCLDLYKTITSTGGDTKAASDACRIAIQASGMSSADFWAKFHPTTATN